MPQSILRQFDTWGSFVDGASKGSDVDIPTSRQRADRSSSWAGTATFEEATELAATGWIAVRPEVLAITEAIRDDLRPYLVDTFQSDFDVAGAAVDIDRYLTGEPECLVQLTPVKVAKPGRVITVLVSAAYSSNIRGEDIKQRGAAIAALVESLELLQHATEVWVEAQAGHGGLGKDTYTVLVKVKAVNEKLDIDRLLFAVAHPAFLRRLWFSVAEQEQPGTRARFGFNGGSYGIAREPGQGKAINATLTLGTLTNSGDPTVSDSAGWIRKHLVEFGLIGQ